MIKYNKGTDCYKSAKEFVKIMANNYNKEDHLYGEVKECRNENRLNKQNFLKICYAKSPRRKKLCERNAPDSIKLQLKKHSHQD